MRLGDHGHNEGQDTHWVAAAAAVLVAFVMLVGSFATFVLIDLDALRPKVGDMVVFRPNTQEQDIWQVEVPVYQPAARGHTTCVLDPAVIARQGGSLVVEARDEARPAAEYRLHWAGAHSANGTGDCAGSADVTVSRIDLQKLANAAGGFGLNHMGVR
jgi:hypothetical protein